MSVNVVKLIKKKKKKKPRINGTVSKRIKFKKENLLKALEASLGVVTPACEQLKIPRKTFYDYYNADPEFRTKVDDLENLALDFAESKLHQNIKAGKEASIFFYLKCKGKKRGYYEKQIFGIEREKETYLNDKEKAVLADALDGIDAKHKSTK